MKKKRGNDLTISEKVKLLQKEILGLYVLFAIFWLYVIVETLIQVSMLVEK